jgi:hypothetical protein
MTKQSPAAQQAITVSPYLSLRQAVRPLIFAHALLTREQERAGELAEECRRLRQLTQELLEAAALVHLLSPEKGVEVVGREGDKRSRMVVEAYAKAGLMWAEVIGSAIGLADALIDNGRWKDVHRLADFLDAAAEPTAAKDLRTRAAAAAKRANASRLAHIHPTMTGPEIASAIRALQDSMDEETVSFYIRDVASAICGIAIGGIAPTSWYRDFSPIFYEGHHAILTWKVKPGDWVQEGQVVAIEKTELSSGSYYDPADLQIDLSGKINKLIIPNGKRVASSTAVASIICPPGWMMDEIEKDSPSIENVHPRLDMLARAFEQIQARNRAQ